MKNVRNTTAALPIVAQSWGNKMGVKVVVGGDSAYTDGKTIVVPHVNESFGSLEPLWGFLLHEAQHVKHTNFNVERKGAFFSSLVNILEDVRIERDCTMEYLGAQKMLDACADYMVKQQHYTHVKSEDSPARIIGSFCLFYGQLKGVKQHFLQQLLDSSTSALRAVAPELEAPLIAILDEAILKMESTQDAADYSRKIMTLIEDIINEQSQQDQDQQQGQGSDDGDGEDQDQQQGQGSDDGDGEDQDQQQGQGSDDGDDEQANSDKSGESSDKNQSHDGNGSKSQQKPNQLTQEQVDSLKEALTALAENCLQDVRDALKKDLYAQHDSSQTNLAEEKEGTFSAYLGAARYRKAMMNSVALRRQFTGLLQSDQQTADRRSRHGKLGRNLAQVVQGETKLFVRRAIKRDTGAAVHILVDMSGSMNTPVSDQTSMFDVAIEAAATMFAALEPLPNTSIGLSYFDCNLVKAIKHGERLSDKKKELGAVPGGSTETGPAILNCIGELLACKQDKRMLFVVTDGCPNYEEELKDALEVAKQHGVTVYGVGIKLPEVKRLFDNAVVINNPSELKTELLSLTRNAL